MTRLRYDDGRSKKWLRSNLCICFRAHCHQTLSFSPSLLPPRLDFRIVADLLDMFLLFSLTSILYVTNKGLVVPSYFRVLEILTVRLVLI
jgi:hypothetical protein